MFPILKRCRMRFFRHNLIKGELILLVIISIILTGAGIPAAVCLASSNTVEIRTPEDLKALSEQSINETATVSRCFVLKNDIDLEGKEFIPISIFAGELDGQGHKITNFYYDEKVSGTGFIRTVTPSGRVRNLSVYGKLTSAGDTKETGGIAGVNFGLVENCSFSGSLLGREITGGIAGHNMNGGIIRKCVNSASVNGTKRTGGIAGFNEGLIEKSENKGDINTSSRTAHELESVKDEEEDLIYDEDEENGFDNLIPDSFDLKDDDLIKRLDSGLKINFTGGIAGVCSGEIRNSLNSGTVGYPHRGYKTGGITGYDRGKVNGCRNEGRIYGRKDIGGIAGQFEPVAENIYSKDALSEAGDALDEVTEKTEKLHKDFGKEDDITQGHIDAIRSSSDELRQVIKDYKEYYRCKDDSVEREIKNRTDNIRSILDGIDLKDYDHDTRDALNALNDNTDKVSKLIDGAGGAAEAGVSPDMTALFSKISDIAATNNAALDTLLDKAIRANKDGKELKHDLEKLRDASNDLDDYVRGCIDDYKKDFRITGDDLEGRSDRIADQADILSEGLKGSDKTVRNDLDALVGALNTLNDSLDRSYGEIQDELQKLHDESIKDSFKDISDDSDTSDLSGIILTSVNDGDIEGDINAGGIVGTVTDDPDTESDFEVVSGGQISLNYSRTKKATIIRCRNNADITVKNDYGGGIVGRADLGAVIDSDNYGRIEAIEGGYAGGIAGKSGFMIRGCRSLCEAAGSKYVGGIAGLLHSGLDNVCLSAVAEDGEYHGALAGDTDREQTDEEDRGTVSGNIFVFKGTGAINGVTVEKEARALTYEELMATGRATSDFSNMTVTFKADGRTVKKIKVPYGGEVEPSDYPELGVSAAAEGEEKRPELYAGENDEGQYGLWEDKDLKKIEQNITVKVIYSDYVTSIASDSSGKPALIVGGRFFDGTALSCSLEEGNGEKDRYGREIKSLVSFGFESSAGIPQNDFYTIRYRLGEESGDYQVYAEEDGVFVNKDLRKDGEYLVFKMKDAGRFHIVELKDKKRTYLLFGGVALLIIAAIAVLVIRKRRKTGQKRVEENGKEQ